MSQHALQCDQCWLLHSGFSPPLCRRFRSVCRDWPTAFSPSTPFVRELCEIANRRTHSPAALSSKAVCTRLETLATSPAMRPATAVSCAISGSTAPASVSPRVRASAMCARSSASAGRPAASAMVACHSPNKLDAKSSTTGSLGSVNFFIDAKVDDHPSGIAQRDGFDAPCPHTTHHDRIAKCQPADIARAERHRTCRTAQC